MVQDRLGAECLKLHLPCIESDDFVGLADVVKQTVSTERATHA